VRWDDAPWEWNGGGVYLIPSVSSLRTLEAPGLALSGSALSQNKWSVTPPSVPCHHLETLFFKLQHPSSRSLRTKEDSPTTATYFSSSIGILDPSQQNHFTFLTLSSWFFLHEITFLSKNQFQMQKYQCGQSLQTMKSSYWMSTIKIMKYVRCITKFPFQIFSFLRVLGKTWVNLISLRVEWFVFCILNFLFYLSVPPSLLSRFLKAHQEDVLGSWNGKWTRPGAVPRFLGALFTIRRDPSNEAVAYATPVQSSFRFFLFYYATNPHYHHPPHQ